MNLKIGIIGIGMVGSVIKKWFEEEKGYKRGENLFCYDTNPDLECNDNVNKADLVVVCVPTPMSESGACDISIVEFVIERLKSGTIVAIKSTVPPGTTVKLQKKYPDKDFLFWPEFLTEKRAWEDFTGRCGRQIIAHTGRNVHQAYELLSLLPILTFIRPWRSNYVTSEIEATEAELAKYFGNVFGATKVTFGNIFYDVCKALREIFQNEEIKARVDYEKVKECVAADQRVGPDWLDVEHGDYRGFGGFCFPKDLSAFMFFIQDTITMTGLCIRTVSDLSKKGELGMLSVRLESAHSILKAIWEYNELLLRQQELSIEDVSYHDSMLAKKLESNRL